MRSRPSIGRAACGLLAFAAAATPCAGQAGFVARLSADTVEVGEEFSLLVRVPVPAAHVVYFPDTLARTDFLESRGRVRWQAEPDASGGAVVTLEYPVLAFAVAVVPVPGFDIFVRPAENEAGGDTIPGGSFVGAWSGAPTSGDAFDRPFRVPRRGVWVNPVFTPEQVEAGMQPAPSADVVGSSWHWPSLATALVFFAVLVTLAVRGAPAWLRRRPGLLGTGEAWTPESSRRHALDELARLSDEGLAASGRMHELYTRSSGAVRLYVSRVIPGLGTDLTSSEVMTRLDASDDSTRPDLAREMRSAEVVKFGRLRPERTAADDHLRSLRAWIEER